MRSIHAVFGTITVFIFAVALTVAPLNSADAQTFEVGDDGNLYIPSDAVVNAPYFGAGANLEINGSMQDDVFLFGALITINGDVDGDVFAFGSVITINGDVSGSVRGAGSTININGSVGKNVMMAGALITVGPEASIGKNLIAAGAQVLAQGSVGKNIHAAGAQIVIDNTVGGSAYLVADEEGGVIIRSQARITDNLEYSGFSEAQITEGAVIGGETLFTLVEEGKYPGRPEFDGGEIASILAGVYITFSLLSMLGLLVVALVYVGLFKKFNDAAQKVVKEKVGMKFLLGLATIVVTPILLALIVATIIGIPLAIIGFVVYGIALYVSKVVVSLWAGDSLIRAFRDKKNKAKPVNQYLAALIGVIVVSLVLAVPVIGWALKIFVVSWGVGVLVAVSRDKLNLT